jgi:hypothetical protein
MPVITSCGLLAVAGILGGFGSPPRGVVLSEIHYHPPAGEERAMEYVELLNAGGAPVSLAGWRLAEGVTFTFPEDAVIPAGSRIVVCRDAALFQELFSDLDEARVFGDFGGALDNSGETILLVDNLNAYVDSVTFDDEAPWPVDADGAGPSLERLCETAPSSEAQNWIAGGVPTPLAGSAAAGCPLPEAPPPSVVISEILYHPSRPERFLEIGDDGEELEYVELHNPGAEAVNVRGWTFSSGITYTFPLDRDTVIGPGGYLVVCRDQEAVRERFSITNATGNYTGKLSNSGERITLLDARRSLVDSVRYREAGDWPYAADGLGRSLERIVPTGPGDDAGNWASSVLSTGVFHHLVSEGRLRGTPTERLLLSVDGAAELIVDNVRLELLDAPGVNLLENGDFETDPFAKGQPWERNGNAASSHWLPGGGVDGSGALRLITSGPCPFTPCSTLDGVRLQLPPGLDREATYRLSMDILYVSGKASGFRGGVFGATGVEFDVVVSPGRQSTIGAPRGLAAISQVRRFPIEPTSRDATWITARVVRGPSGDAPRIVLAHNGGVFGAGSGLEAEMLDDGLHRDGLAGDGIYGAELAPFPHDTAVRFRVEARGRDGVTTSPRLQDVSAPLPEEVWGYYVNDNRPDTGSGMPLYHILLHDEDGRPVDGTDFNAVNRHLSCSQLTPGSFVFEGELYPDVGIRWRGNTMCVVDKRNFKIRFNQGRLFRGLRKLNLNSMWTDKSLAREHLSWQLLKEIGVPFHETEYSRVHVNGVYYGLFLYLEHPDSRFLENHGLDPEGNLYKALQPPRGPSLPIGVSQKPAEDYPLFWEEETNEDGNLSDLAEFIDAMHADGQSPNRPSVAFWQSRSDEDMIIGYQIGQVVLNNIDSFAKNHFLYHDLRADRWGFLTFDLDLTFGKFFTVCAVDATQGRQVGTLNDLVLCDPPAHACRVPSQLDPWFATTVIDSQVLNWLVDFFFRAGDTYYQRSYLMYLWDILEEKYTNESYDPQIDDLAAAIAGEAAEDFDRWGRYSTNVPGFPEDLLGNMEVIKEQIACHREYLMSFIRENHPEISDHPRVKITEIMYRPVGGDDDLEYLELVNLTEGPVDLGLWSIGGGIEFTFRPESRVEAGEVFIVARSPADFARLYPGLEVQVFGPYAGRLDDDGEAIRLRDGVPGFGADYPATVDFVPYESAGSWPEALPGQSVELTQVSPRRDNDRGGHWRAAAGRGGSPGTIDLAAGFRRGDVNADARLNLTDPVFVLNYLFLSSPAPGCLDAADTNDDGVLNLTDGLFLLNYLFLGGPELPSPHGEPGLDPTPDALSCLGA